MITVAEAKARILKDLSPVGSETVPLAQGFGRVLAEPVAARLTRPARDTSAMDGYAVRAADLTGGTIELREVDHIPAGRVSSRTLQAGECARIFTGGWLPPGADTILIQEDAGRRESPEGVSIQVKQAPDAGAYVRPAGFDFAEGDTLAKPGERLTSRKIGLIAAGNVPWLVVRRRPRIAILATGDEIVLPGEAMQEGQIAGSGSHAMAGLVHACGGEPVMLGVAPDEPGALAEAAGQAKGCDFLVTIGGASVGDYDLVHDVLGDGGLSIDFQKIAMRPGKPLMFGASGDVRLLGLPGNPVSSYVCALLFLRPALLALAGCPQDDLVRTLPCAAELPANGAREHYMRARLTNGADGPAIEPFGDQDSSLVSVLAEADGLIVRPVGAGPVPAGTPVPVILFETGPANL